MQILNRFIGAVMREIDGETLAGANLYGANLYGADLCGADLRSADLCGASIILGGHRSDGYFFTAIQSSARNEIIIHAGCRRFTPAEARAHWAATRAGTQLGKESLAIVDHLERLAKIRGWIKASTGNNGES